MEALLIISFLVLLFIGVPVGYSMGLSSFIFLVVGALTGSSIPLEAGIQRIVLGVNSFPLMAVPFFILAGEFMNEGGITRKLIDLAKALVGHFRGGLAHISILASMMFSAMSGSSIACATIFGKLMLPEMKKEGYDPAFSSAVISCAATMGPIIPPSVTMVVYAVMANASVSKLFLAGIIPGVLIAIGMMIAAYFVSKKQNYPVGVRATPKELLVSARKAILPMFMPLIIIGGIIFGIFTPTEAALIAAFYAALLGIIYKEFRFRDLPKVALRVATGSGKIMFIMANAALFGWLLTMEQTPAKIASMLLSVSNNFVIQLLIINLFLLILGMFMETGSIIILTVPILLPIVASLGIDPIQFGLIMVINVLIGTVTVPVGVCMYITNDLAGVTMGQYFKHVKIFYLVLFLVLMCTTFIPPLTLMLPNLLLN